MQGIHFGSYLPIFSMLSFPGRRIKLVVAVAVVCVWRATRKSKSLFFLWPIYVFPDTIRSSVTLHYINRRNKSWIPSQKPFYLRDGSKLKTDECSVSDGNPMLLYASRREKHWTENGGRTEWEPLCKWEIFFLWNWKKKLESHWLSIIHC